MKDAASAPRATERVRRFYDRSAADYDGWMRLFDRLLLGDGRGSTCARARGQTLELAIGTGLNLAFYRRDVGRRVWCWGGAGSGLRRPS